ncbi:MAG: M15 family metallopeptidase [Lewinellaceae bacterium]|nr:M15 family metallopeptidase [Lewinellaceae bacterium]
MFTTFRITASAFYSALFLSLLIACQPAGPGAKQPQDNEPPARLASALPADTQAFDTDYLMGRFDPASHPDFTLVENRYASRAGLYLRKDTYDAFLKMYEAAKKDGITLTILSATRNFDYQKGIWEAKWTGATAIENGKNASEAYPNPTQRALKILEYSSMPGSSRHHWGTDMDLNALNNEHFETGQGLKTYQWLVANAPGFGFCQPYSPKGEARPYGYNEEKWHWSYLPIALPLTQLAREKLKDEMIQGFKGAETAREVGVVEKYVLGINAICL